MRRGDCFAVEIASSLRRCGWACEEAATNVCPYALLAGETWESYLRTLGAGHRVAFQRKLRRLRGEFDVRLAEVADAGECRAALDGLKPRT